MNHRISVKVENHEEQELRTAVIRDHFMSPRTVPKLLTPYLRECIILPTMAFRERMAKVHGVDFLRLCDVLEWATHTTNVRSLMTYIEQKNNSSKVED
jgi:hypothetical protein